MSSTANCPRPTMRKLHRTTLHMLEHAAKKAHVKFETLPHHAHLRFESVDRSTIDFNTPKVSIKGFRLIIGSSKSSRDTVYTPVYAYICRRNNIDQALLQWNTQHLTVKDMDNISWIAPFNLIYDTYGQTERACSKIGAMAAYYFLAASYVLEVTTENRNFAETLIRLCQKIYKPVAILESSSQDAFEPNHPTRHFANDSNHFIQREGNKLAPSSSLMVASIDQYQATCANRKLPNKGDIKALTVDYKIKSNGGRSSIPNKNISLFLNSSSGRENSIVCPDVFSGRNHYSLTHQVHDRAKVLPTAIGSANLTPEYKAGHQFIDTERLAAFFQVSKHGKVEGPLLQEAEAKSIDLQTVLDRTDERRQRTYTELENLWNKPPTQHADSLHVISAPIDAPTKSGTQSRKSTHNLQSDKAESGRKIHIHEGIQTQLNAMESERKAYRKRLISTERESILKEKIVNLRSELEIMRIEKQNLEAELSVERAAFKEYKRRIRNLSILP